MRWEPLQVVGGAYKDDATPWTCQDTVNYIPVLAERDGTRSPAMLRQAPGCALECDTGSDSAIRGLHNAEGLLLAVTNNTLYTIGTDGVASSQGTIPGVGRCSIAHNQISAGNEVGIATGDAGYIYNTATDTLVQITDDAFPGAKVFDFLDGYLLWVEPLGRYWGHSDLVAGTSHSALDRYEAEAAPDKIVSLLVSGGDVLIFGERTTEVWYNSGAATGTFQRSASAMDIGCAATHTPKRIDNGVIWLGHDGSVYRWEGGAPIRISTHAIEQAIARCVMTDAWAMVLEDQGHKIYYLTFPDGQTWGYDMASREWHRRKSYGLDFWRMAHLEKWNGGWIAGDYTNGKLYRLHWTGAFSCTEDNVEMERSRTLPPLHDNGNRIIVHGFMLNVDTGKTPTSREVEICERLNLDVQIFDSYDETIDNDLGVVTDVTISLDSGAHTAAPVIFTPLLAQDGLPLDLDFTVTGYPNYLYLFFRDSASFIHGKDWPGAVGTGSKNILINLIDGTFTADPMVNSPGTQFNEVDEDNNFVGAVDWDPNFYDFTGDPYDGSAYSLRWEAGGEGTVVLSLWVEDTKVFDTTFAADEIEGKVCMFGFDHWNEANSVTFGEQCYTTTLPANRERFIDIGMSKDGGHIFADWRKLPLPATGQFCKQIETRRWGQARQAVLRWRVTDDVRADVFGGSIIVEPCN